MLFCLGLTKVPFGEHVLLVRFVKQSPVFLGLGL